MKFIKTPVKGMPEQTPSDMIIREFVLRKIKDTYKKYGFCLINTPFIEHIENLTNKQGGENEKLIFKILKRGDKFEKSLQNSEELCDCGLRYDLTLPLSRFYANNLDKLPTPFKSLQIGESFRADRPQNGRFRQFTQCDIDILGDNSSLAEIELITATTNMLNELGITNAKVRVNDRNILKAMALSCDFPVEKLDTIFIILDKLDHIGLNGVKESLINLGLKEENVLKYCSFFENSNLFITSKEFLQNKLEGFLDDKIIKNLDNIILSVKNLINKNNKIVFDPTLVRGMSYYTGPIFEIELSNYNLSVAGGGRYDNMIGNFCGKQTPACGFSIGFERIISIIKENNLIKPETQKQTAVLIDKNVNKSKLNEILLKANSLREKDEIVSIIIRNKNAKFQKEQLEKLGYTNFVEIFEDKGDL